MAGGAAITVITKSGTNNFKGSAFAFYNNENLNAKAYFATVKNPASAHIDGATIGGPIQKNRLFFFGAWEGQYQTTPQQFFYNVPPAGSPCRRFQPGVQPRWIAAGHLRPAHGQSRRHGSCAVSRQHDSGGPDRFHRPEDSEPVPATEHRQRPVERQCWWSGLLPELPAESPPEIRPEQLRPEAQLEPIVRGAGLGQIRTHGGQRSRRCDPPLAVSPTAGTAIRHVNMYTFGTTWTINSTTVLDATYGISRMTHETTDRGLQLRQLRSRRARDSRHERWR